VGRIYLLANEIKKGRDDFGVWLNLPSTRYLKFYVEKVRPEVIRRRGSNSDNPYLFPSYGARHRPLGLITKHWVNRCKEAGFELDLHANRHLTAMIILQRDVNAMPLVQKILGHKNLRTTEDYYAEVKDYLVQAEFQTHLEEAEHALSLDLLVALKGVKK
jgi:integrase